jgi:hypothetical protein
MNKKELKTAADVAAESEDSETLGRPVKTAQFHQATGVPGCFAPAKTIGVDINPGLKMFWDGSNLNWSMKGKSGCWPGPNVAMIVYP